MLNLLLSNRLCLTIKPPIRHSSSVLTRVLTGVGNREIYRRLKVAEIRMDLLWICHFNEHFYSHPRCPREMIDSAIAARWEYQRDSKSLARLHVDSRSLAGGLNKRPSNHWSTCSSNWATTAPAQNTENYKLTPPWPSLIVSWENERKEKYEERVSIQIFG